MENNFTNEFGVVGVTVDGQLVLSNGFKLSGVSVDEIKHIEKEIGCKLPTLVYVDGIGWFEVEGGIDLANGSDFSGGIENGR